MDLQQLLQKHITCLLERVCGADELGMCWGLKGNIGGKILKGVHADMVKQEKKKKASLCCAHGYLAVSKHACSLPPFILLVLQSMYSQR